LKPAALSDFFRCTYVINLPERKDRRRAIVSELTRAGMPLAAGRVEMFPAVKPREKMGFPNTGARGCFLSHLGILTRALERRLSNVLIVEDDLIVSPMVNRHLEAIVRHLEATPWGLVYLGHIEDVSPAATPRLVPFDRPLVTSHFYAVNGPTIPRLVDYLEQVQRREAGHPLGGPMHLDGALNMFRQANPDVLTLIAHPNLGWQRPSRSNINCKWYERLPVVKQAADLARAFRESLRA
jgi:glycosyl transferase family 25